MIFNSNQLNCPTLDVIINGDVFLGGGDALVPRQTCQNKNRYALTGETC